MTTIPVKSNGSTILGIPIGENQFIQDCCVESVRSGDILCKQLAELDDIQSAMLLLRFCYIPRINHLARSVSPELLNPAADLHDFSIEDNIYHLDGVQFNG